MKKGILLLGFFVLCFLPNHLPAETIFQGFESGSLTSGGWTQVTNNSFRTWNIDNKGPHSGNYLAAILYDETPNFQDEWLLSPSITPTFGNFTVEAYSLGSPYWSDNYSLNAWLVYDMFSPDNVFIGKLNSTWTDEFVWSYANYNLSGLYNAGVPVRIGFQYIGLDGADAGIDDILIRYNSVPEPAGLVLLGLGIVGIAGFRRRIK